MISPRFPQVLEADNNSIENLEGVYHLPKLEEVLLKNNSILLNHSYSLACQGTSCSGCLFILQHHCHRNQYILAAYTPLTVCK